VRSFVRKGKSESGGRYRTGHDTPMQNEQIDDFEIEIPDGKKNKEEVQIHPTED
jgi:hypothetical protein